ARHGENTNSIGSHQTPRDVGGERLMAMSPNEHTELREQIELYAVGALTPAERSAFEAHLADCEECRAAVRSFIGVAEALPQVVPQHDPPAALRSRVLAAVGATPGNRGAAPASGGRSGTFAPWLAAAALLIVSVGLAVETSALRSRIADLERRLAQAIARSELNDRRVA